MKELVVIGNAAVLIRNSEHLTGALSGLKRRPCAESAMAERAPDATLHIEIRDKRDWELGVVEQNNTHSFGRPTYVFRVEPLNRLIRLAITSEPKGNDLYWFQRDIFGALSCMSGDLMLHSSALIAPDGGAWVFCGASGAGKSAICRALASKGLSVINDEVNWLRFNDDNNLRIINQPFWFLSGEKETLPVTRLHLLRQADSCALRPPPRARRNLRPPPGRTPFYRQRVRLSKSSRQRPKTPRRKTRH